MLWVPVLRFFGSDEPNLKAVSGGKQSFGFRIRIGAVVNLKVEGSKTIIFHRNGFCAALRKKAAKRLQDEFGRAMKKTQRRV
jgi:hypothetical protein